MKRQVGPWPQPPTLASSEDWLEGASPNASSPPQTNRDKAAEGPTFPPPSLPPHHAGGDHAEDDRPKPGIQAADAFSSHHRSASPDGTLEWGPGRRVLRCEGANA